MNAETEQTTPTEAPPLSEVTTTREAAPPRKTTMGALLDKKKDKAPLTVDGEAAIGRTGETPEMRSIDRAADQELKEWLGAVAQGTGHEFKIERLYPTSHNGVNVGGHLETLGEMFTEEDIKERFGGGTFKIRVMRPTAKGGHLAGPQRQIKIAGDPKISGVPRTLAEGGAAAPVTVVDRSGEKAADAAFSILRDELKHSREVAARPHADPMPQSIQASLEAANRRADEARQEKPVEDPFKQKMIEQLMSEEGTRVQGVRMMYESEIRQLKDSAREDQNRLRESFERDKQMLHLATERELQTVRQASEMTLSSVKTANETQITLLKHELARAEKLLDRQDTEMRELRALKEKPLTQQIKDMNELRNALGAGEADEPEGTAEKIIGVLTNPAAIDFAQNILSGRQNAQAAQAQTQQVAQQQAEASYKPKIMRDRKGRTFALGPKGEIVPVKKKPLQVATGQTDAAGAPIEVSIPAIDAEVMTRIVALLEGAFTSNADPKTFIQSYRVHIPDEVVDAVRELKVDGFLSKVAKLPASSPLKTQAGRTWMRKVGDELLGEVTPDP